MEGERTATTTQRRNRNQHTRDCVVHLSTIFSNNNQVTLHHVTFFQANTTKRCDHYLDPRHKEARANAGEAAKERPTLASCIVEFCMMVERPGTDVELSKEVISFRRNIAGCIHSVEIETDCRHSDVHRHTQADT